MAKKRNNGEGTIRMKKAGQWEAAVMEGKENGKPKMKYFTGRTKKEVVEKLNKWRMDKMAGLNVTQYRTFTEWSNYWYENHKNTVTPTTQENYKYTLRILQDYFGDCLIADVKPMDVEAFLQNLVADGSSESKYVQCRGMLYQIFKKALGNDFVRKNPVEFIEKHRSKTPPMVKDAFTEEEIRVLMTDLPNNKIGWSIRLLLGTGMRSQELLALGPDDIEEDGSVIHIRHAVNMVKGRAYVGEPKSKDSYRDVPVPSNLQLVAVALRETNSKYIWQSPKRDGPCNPSFFRDEYKKAMELVEGVRMLTPHSCRHTFVTQMQALGVDIPTIQSIVGHADMDMTQHYLHIRDSVQQDAVKKFSTAFPEADAFIPVLEPVVLF
jgi:integrase